MKHLKLFESFNTKISEELQYHIDNNISIVENIFRFGSDKYYDLIKETRDLYNQKQIELINFDDDLFESTDIGLFALYEGLYVPLDLPILNEAEYKGLTSVN